MKISEIKMADWFYRVEIRAAALLLVFVFSLTYWLLNNNVWETRTFYFPLDSYQESDIELKTIKRAGSLSANIEEYVKELLLGNVILYLNPITPNRGTIDLNVCIYNSKEKKLYLDFSKEIVDVEGTFPYTLEQSAEQISINIRKNFPMVEEIIFSVEGQTISSPFYN